MLFHTLDFVFFFLALYLFYRYFPEARSHILLAGSLFFYGFWNFRILALLVATVAVNYGCARWMENSSSRQKKAALIIALAINFALLGLFKYYGFFVESLSLLLDQFNLHPGLPVLEILLPAGISFYTFELTSYSVDVYRGMKAERSFGRLLLFATFFPKMMAGPIARAAQLIPQFSAPQIKPGSFLDGSALALLGLFKKVVIADQLALAVNRLIGNTHAPATLSQIGFKSDLDALTLIFAGSLFAVQIYADFSGYSDMARGMSRMLGIELIRNFEHPFLSSNPAEFWRRWHITLGAFLRDYVYIPLGGSRVASWVQARNIMIVWALGGLWHGASIGYLVWGLYCGALVVLYQVLRPLLVKTGQTGARIGVIVTFLSFGLGLMIFRLGTPQALLLVLGHWKLPGFTTNDGFALLLCVPFLISHAISNGAETIDRLRQLPWFAKVIIANAMFYIFLFIGRFQGEEFFYFRF
ncbi:MAG: MBOAT family protein [Spirochaetia bacterium]|nr:MBOAT family protein [Spirochaetia bacterium]